MDDFKNIVDNLITTTIDPASTETSTDCLSSVLHAVTDYNKTVIENTLFRHELVLKENAVLSWR
jgi:hypothetical protein